MFADPTITPLATQVTVSAIVVAFIQWLKASKYFPWITAGTKTLNRVLSVLLSLVQAIGIHMAWNHGAVPGSYEMEVTGLTLMGVATAAWAIVKSFVMNELIYRTAANNTPKTIVVQPVQNVSAAKL